MGINPFGIVQVGCGLTALGFSFSDWESWRPEPTVKCSALGLPQDLQNWLVRLIQGLGFGQCELEMALSDGGEFMGSSSRHPFTLPVLLSPLPLEPFCLPAFFLHT